ncbi:MAG TPA: VWA domain-containing protein [Ilumatobacteraceae bacterium]|nr:VWA domain-containing protein [Ilumatobacteraceae bacterium]
MPVVVIAAIAGALVAWGRWRRGDSRSQVLRWLGLWLVLLAMSTDPTVGGSTVQMVGTNADVLFVVDTTGSIAAEDYNGREPRLNGVRADIVEIAKSFPGARYSLITFDSDAALELPWTTDLGALTSLAYNISVLELVNVGQRVQSRTFDPVPILITTALLYLIMTTLLTQITNGIERYYDIEGRIP